MDTANLHRRDFDEQGYRMMISTAIGAVKAGDFVQARELLTNATALKPVDPVPWLWLTETTEDLHLKREFLENALAADPNNTAARRGLVKLSERLAETRLLEIGEVVEPVRNNGPQPAQISQAYLCSKCGGALRFDTEKLAMVCDHCDAIQEIETVPAADTAEQVLDFVLPTEQGHLWAASQQRLKCSRCGVEILLPPEQKILDCPYCNSSQLVEPEDAAQLIDPHVLALPQIDEGEARRRMRTWLGHGLFVSEDFERLAYTADLHLAYYPFWTFDGTLEVTWACEVNQGSSKNPQWVRREGYEYENFDDVLVAGLKKIDRRLLRHILPFELKKVVEFDPQMLAGATALGYELSLADASLQARELVVKRLRKNLSGRVALGEQKRNLTTGGLNWSGMTFKHALLPIWVGSYTYEGQLYRVMVNAQTGRVAGQKPRRQTQVKSLLIAVLAVLGFAAVAALLAVLYFSFIA